MSHYDAPCQIMSRGDACYSLKRVPVRTSAEEPALIVDTKT